MKKKKYETVIDLEWWKKTIVRENDTKKTTGCGIII